MDKVTVCVLFGGCSEEHPISVKSAMEVAAHLGLEKYEPVYIGITQEGEWKRCERPAPDWENQPAARAVLSPDRSIHGLVCLEDGRYRVLRVDVVLPVIHGKTGEDGAIQGLLELSGIPYVGCGIESSVLCMDKSLAYMAVRQAGIPTPEFSVYSGGPIPDASPFSYPVFVKPARSGSSFGVSKVTRKEDFPEAFRIALQYDTKVLVEEAVEGREVGCALLGSGEELTVGAVDEISLSHGFFRIHQEPHPEQGSQNAAVLVPAPLSADVSLQIQETAKAIYRALGCEGLARVDMFLKPDGRILLNEVNTFPGFTAYSRYPRMMAAAGLGLSAVLDRMIAWARKG